MDLRYTDAEQDFRHELRKWLEDAVAAYPPEPAPDDWATRRVWDTGWQRMLFDAGYAGINWPKEYGGRGATPTEHLIYIEESDARARALRGRELRRPAPRRPDAHRRGHARAEGVPPPADPQAASRSGARASPSRTPGSDLASLRTRAVRDGDDYVINGQKIWTSFGHVADYCEMLVRTDPDVPKHKGITWLIVPMDSPGIDIRPLRAMEGTTEFCEVFLDEVRVPVVNRVGDENDGWRVTNVTFELRARHRVRRRHPADPTSCSTTSCTLRSSSPATARRAGRTRASGARSGTSQPSSTRSGR